MHADLLAKEKLKELLALDNKELQALRPTHLPYEKCSVYWQNNKGQHIKICSHLQKSLTQNIESERIREFWKKKGKFTPYTERFIDWEHVHKSHRRVTPAFHQFLSKWITGFCGVGAMMKIWKFQTHSKCPRCQMDNENTSHVLQCPHPSAHSLWKEEMKSLDQWMKNNQLHPELRECIVTNLQSWHDGSPYPAKRYTNQILQRAITKQDLIGWRAFIEGFIVIEWKQCQREFMLSTQRSPDLLFAKLQQKIWELVWTMWEHRNKHLHSDDYPIHQFELSELNTTIIAELLKGTAELPRRYHRLFKGTVQERMNDNIYQKRQWLTSVWAARERGGADRTQNTNSESRVFYTCWKRRHVTP